MRETSGRRPTGNGGSARSRHTDGQGTYSSRVFRPETALEHSSSLLCPTAVSGGGRHAGIIQVISAISRTPAPR
jgi:hypothetical protein